LMCAHNFQYLTIFKEGEFDDPHFWSFDEIQYRAYPKSSQDHVSDVH